MRRLVILLTLMGSLISCSDTSHDPASNATTDAMTASLPGSPSALIWQGQCAACHGAVGEGNRALGAPGLTQLSADYIARQLKHFVSGVRGAETGDKAGKRMALSVANLSEVDISSLLSSLPRNYRRQNQPPHCAATQRARITTSTSAAPATAAMGKAMTPWRPCSRA